MTRNIVARPKVKKNSRWFQMGQNSRIEQANHRKLQWFDKSQKYRLFQILAVLCNMANLAVKCNIQKTNLKIGIESYLRKPQPSSLFHRQKLEFQAINVEILDIFTSPERWTYLYFWGRTFFIFARHCFPVGASQPGTNVGLKRKQIIKKGSVRVVLKTDWNGSLTCRQSSIEIIAIVVLMFQAKP